MADQPTSESISQAITTQLHTLGLQTWESATEESTNFLKAIESHCQNTPTTNKKLKALERNIRATKNSILHWAREAPNMENCMRAIRAYNDVYASPKSFKKLYGSRRGYEEQAEEHAVEAEKWVRLEVEMKSRALASLQEYERLKEEFQRVSGRLAPVRGRERKGGAKKRAPRRARAAGTGKLTASAAGTVTLLSPVGEN
ncbi:hypothetical protein BDW02DRAFT_575415 [Decorospora gaudefroyi]|uniref:Uncharacterized protein n=1 Tax=Decorospora gaudefroyi TaxID=184978 RepID=A0A6A5KX60_9PLEO|nr:hypothetical protein BDW02DRAFT_575415 [Decorospora gaudefroyi]